MSKKNKPSIRFAGFTDDLEQRKFGDLAEYKKGPFGSAITKDMFVPKSKDSIKVYEQQNVINKDWSLERYFLPKEYALTKLKSFEVHGGDIIVSCAGTIGEIYEISENAETGIINQALMRVRVNESVINKKMFIIAFTSMINEFSKTHSNGSAIKNIPPFADLKPMEVFLPSIMEQTKISEYFDSLDSLIALHQRKYDKLVNIKKSMLEKMFPREGEKVPELRFAGFTDDWERRKMSELVDYLSSSLTAKDTIGDGMYDLYDANSLIGKTNHKPIDVDYITVIKDGAGVGRIRKLPKNSMFIGTMGGLIAKGTDIDFIYSMLTRFDLGRAYSGSTIPHIYFKDYGKNEYYVPNIDEQQVIGFYFKNLDNLITLHQCKVEKLKKIKSSMMEKMFV